MEQTRSSASSSTKVSLISHCAAALNKNHLLFRMAKTKLPKHIKKKIDEWKFRSGALVLCLVAYRNGQDVQTFQCVYISHLFYVILREEIFDQPRCHHCSH